MSRKLPPPPSSFAPPPPDFETHTAGQEDDALLTTASQETSLRSRPTGRGAIGADEVPYNLPDGWEAAFDAEGQIYFIDHSTKTTSWIPPETVVIAGKSPSKPRSNKNESLPYGWELAVDDNGVVYFIDHVNRTTTRHDPRTQQMRSLRQGTEPHQMKLNLRQLTSDEDDDLDDLDDGAPPPPPMPAAPADTPFKSPPTKAKRHSISTLSIAEAVRLRRPFTVAPTIHDMPEFDDDDAGRVLKVMLEDGQTRSLQFNEKTTCADMCSWIARRINVTSIDHFALFMEEAQGKFGRWLKPSRRIIDAEGSWPIGSGWRYRFRVRYVPLNAADMCDKDPVAFDYWYTQVVRDVTDGNFTKLSAREIKRLAGFQTRFLLQRAQHKFDIDYLENTVHFNKIFPAYVLESMKPKEVKKAVIAAHKLCKSLTARECQFQYLQLLGDLPEFGGQTYRVRLERRKEESSSTRMLVGPRHGLAILSDEHFRPLTPLVPFQQMAAIEIQPLGSGKARLDLFSDLHNGENEPIHLVGEMSDMQDMATLMDGYFHLYVNPTGTLLSPADDGIPEPPPPIEPDRTVPSGNDESDLARALAGVSLRKTATVTKSNPDMDDKGISANMILQARQRMRKIGALKRAEDGSVIEFDKQTLKVGDDSKSPAPKYESTHRVLDYDGLRAAYSSEVVDLAKAPPKYVAGALTEFKFRKTGLDLRNTEVRPQSVHQKEAAMRQKSVDHVVTTKARLRQTLSAFSAAASISNSQPKRSAATVAPPVEFGSPDALASLPPPPKEFDSLPPPPAEFLSSDPSLPPLVSTAFPEPPAGFGLPPPADFANPTKKPAKKVPPPKKKKPKVAPFAVPSTVAESATTTTHYTTASAPRSALSLAMRSKSPPTSPAMPPPPDLFAALPPPPDFATAPPPPVDFAGSGVEDGEVEDDESSDEEETTSDEETTSESESESEDEETSEEEEESDENDATSKDESSVQQVTTELPPPASLPLPPPSVFANPPDPVLPPPASTESPRSRNIAALPPPPPDFATLPPPPFEDGFGAPPLEEDVISDARDEDHESHEEEESDIDDEEDEEEEEEEEEHENDDEEAMQAEAEAESQAYKAALDSIEDALSEVNAAKLLAQEHALAGESPNGFGIHREPVLSAVRKVAACSRQLARGVAAPTDEFPLLLESTAASVVRLADKCMESASDIPTDTTNQVTLLTLCGATAKSCANLVMAGRTIGLSTDTPSTAMAELVRTARACAVAVADLQAFVKTLWADGESNA